MFNQQAVFSKVLKSISTFNKTLVVSGAIGASLFANINTIHAEDINSKVGRYKDGTAYRIDDQGSEIVDHVAELELKNSELTRQVKALESDLEQKEELIRTLSEEANEPKLPVFKNKADANSKAKLSQLEKQLEQRVRDNEILRLSLKETRDELASSSKRLQELTVSSNDLQRTITRMNSQANQFSSTQKRDQQVIREFTDRESKLRDKLIAARRDLENSKLQMSTLRKDYDRANVTTRSVTRQADRNIQQFKKANPFPRTQVVKAAPRYASKPRARLDTVRVAPSPTLTKYRRLALGAIQKLQARTATRDSMYHQYTKRKNRVVNFSPSKLSLAGGMTPSGIRQLVIRSTSIEELGRISKQIATLNKRVESDISLMKRLS